MEGLELGPYAIISLESMYYDAKNHGLKLPCFLSEESHKMVKNAATEVTFERVSTDLSQFSQSKDLELMSADKLPPALNKFLTLMKSEGRQLVESIFEMKTDLQLTMTISKYSKGDYLLCHDDFAGTRAVAFVYYLNDLDEGDGGALRFFSHNNDQEPLNRSFCEKIIPEENTLVLFKVSQTSHHEVEQMYTEKERVTINGWFHSSSTRDDDVLFVNRFFKSRFAPLTMDVYSLKHPYEIVSQKLLEPQTIQEMAVHLQADKAIIINEVLKTSFFNSCRMEFDDITEHRWETKGPANFRQYETLPYDVEGPHICFGESYYHVNILVDYLLSAKFMEVLANLAKVAFAVFEDARIAPTCMLEIQRWKAGSYSLLCDTNIEKEMPTIEVTIYFRVDKAKLGRMTTESDLSGIPVIAVKPTLLSPEDTQLLFKVKCERIFAEHKVAAIKRKETLKTPRKEEKLCTAIKKVVARKLKRNHEYRQELCRPSFLIPSDNTMIIAYGSKSIDKHTSYIKRAGPPPRFPPLPWENEDVCYYAINITYFTTDAS